MKSKNIQRIENFSLEKYLEQIDYKIPQKELIVSDLLLIPYGPTNKDRYPAFVPENTILQKRLDKMLIEGGIQTTLVLEDKKYTFNE